MKGPKGSGNWSAHIGNLVASGATSALTVWYSNLPEPDVTNDAHWVQDIGIAAVDLTAVANTMISKAGCAAEWIRFKPAVAASGGTMFLWYRAEGLDV